MKAGFEPGMTTYAASIECCRVWGGDVSQAGAAASEAVTYTRLALPCLRR